MTTWASQPYLSFTSVTSQNFLNFTINLNFGIHTIGLVSLPRCSVIDSVHLWSVRASGGWSCLGMAIYM